MIERLFSMFCSSCGHPLPENAVFCMKCGTRATALATPSCSSCGAEIPKGSAFCAKCGTKINALASWQPNFNQGPKERGFKVLRPACSDKPRIVYIVLALFFGCLGIHNFYAGRFKYGILQLVLSVLVIGVPAVLIWSLLEAALVDTDGEGREMRMWKS